MKAEGEKDIMSLVRCAWAGSQKYGVLTWSGDVYSSFRSMRERHVLVLQPQSQGKSPLFLFVEPLGGITFDGNGDTRCVAVYLAYLLGQGEWEMYRRY